MTKSISAIYDNGVFRPLAPVDLPDQTPVVVTPMRVAGTGDGIRATAGAWADDEAALQAWFAKLDDMRRQDRSLLCPDEQAP
jgi:hypothetical protein